MEAPERIYLFRNRIGVVLDSWYLNPCNQLENIEYTRTDAFIEKASEWLKEHKEAVETEDNGIIGWIPDYFIEDFRNYMKGE